MERKRENKVRSGIKKSIAALILLLTVIMMIPGSAEAAKVKLNKKAVTLLKGKTYTLKVKGTKKKAKWKTSKKAVAKLTSVKKTSVKIKAVKTGKATVSAKVGKKTYKCKVTVVDPKISKTKITLTEGQTAVIKVTGGTGSVKWQSANTSIAMVNQGRITAKKAGTVKISAIRNKKKLTCMVTVKKKSTGDGGGGTNTPTPKPEINEKTDAEKAGLRADYTGLVGYVFYYKGEEVTKKDSFEKYRLAMLNDEKYGIFREQYNKYYHANMTDAQKVYAVWNSVGHIGITYTSSSVSYSFSQVLDSKQGVCAHYSAFVKLFGDLYGLEVYDATSGKRNHDWNLIKINNQFYYLDATYLKLENSAEEDVEIAQYNVANTVYRSDAEDTAVYGSYDLPISGYTKYGNDPYCIMKNYNIFSTTSFANKDSLDYVGYLVKKDGLWIQRKRYQDGKFDFTKVFVCK